MRLREAIASMLHLLVVGVFAAIACFFLFLPSQIDWRIDLIRWLQDQPVNFCWLGLFFSSMTILFMMGFFGIGRGRFLRLLMKPHVAIVDSKLLRQTIEDCFRIHFPKNVRGVDIDVISRQRLDVAVDLLPLEEKQQGYLLREMEKQLFYLLRSRFGYSRPFTLSIRVK
jgi:hypothetical protein